MQNLQLVAIKVETMEDLGAGKGRSRQAAQLVVRQIQLHPVVWIRAGPSARDESGERVGVNARDLIASQV